MTSRFDLAAGLRILSKVGGDPTRSPWQGRGAGPRGTRVCGTGGPVGMLALRFALLTVFGTRHACHEGEKK